MLLTPTVSRAVAIAQCRSLSSSLKLQGSFHEETYAWNSYYRVLIALTDLRCGEVEVLQCLIMILSFILQGQPGRSVARLPGETRRPQCRDELAHGAGGRTRSPHRANAHADQEAREGPRLREVPVLSSRGTCCSMPCGMHSIWTKPSHPPPHTRSRSPQPCIDSDRLALRPETREQ